MIKIKFCIVAIVVIIGFFGNVVLGQIPCLPGNGCVPNYDGGETNCLVEGLICGNGLESLCSGQLGRVPDPEEVGEICGYSFVRQNNSSWPRIVMANVGYVPESCEYITCYKYGACTIHFDENLGWMCGVEDPNDLLHQVMLKCNLNINFQVECHDM